VATPVISPAGGTFATKPSVTITCATSGAVIYYTTNGSAPTLSSPIYSTAIAITTTTTVKAYATASGMTDSAVASNTYTLQAGAPALSPVPATYATAQNVTLTSATPAAVIHYTTDGSAPTAASSNYLGPIPLALNSSPTTTTVKAYATATGFQDSTVTSGTYVIDASATPAATPTFSPGAGSYGAAQSVTISTTTSGASIYYTTDGSTPTTASTLYAAPVAVASSLTLKAIASGNGHTASAVGSAAYVINLPKAATPTFSPLAGSYTGTQSVTISSATPGASLYYTTDGSTPTTGSTHYTAPVPVASSLTLKAVATATGYLQSDVGSSAYVIGAGGTDFATVCTTFFNKQVSLLTSCYSANPDLVSSSLGAQQGFCAAWQKEITAGLITYSATQGAACLTAVNALSCADVFSESVITPASCNAALVGTVANGTGAANQCYSSNDCANGFCTWELNAGTCPGHCQAYPGLGNDCSTAPFCATGQSCGSATGTLVCTAQATTVGGTCPCADNLWCDYSVLPTPTCKAFLAQGAACSLTTPCGTGLACVGTGSPTCKALVGLGGACTPSLSGQTECGLGYACDSGTSKCVSWPTVGGNCMTIPRCVNAYCNLPTTTCVALLADGATCTSSQQCSSQDCDTASTHTCLAASCSLP
jgi:hypothetical protein